ncbi:MAG: hypothetical protein KME18_16880 [Phormidium tanganyikae FI6-MK23]|nr:hypothetical protein [Phormidium tanganyikae FI6-MK23]
MAGFLYSIEETQPSTSIASELSVQSDGVGRSTIRGAARICGVDEKAISYSLKSAGEETPSKLAQMLVNQGFDGGEVRRFVEDGIPNQALAIIIELSVQPDGVGRSTVWGAPRICGVDHASLMWHFQTGELVSSKLAQMLIAQGCKSGELKRFTYSRFGSDLWS